jgi:type IV pilus assembly protein PilC
MMNWKKILFEVDLLGKLPARKAVRVRQKRSWREKPAWRGPWYAGQATKRRHLVLFTVQSLSIVRCNAPLTRGLAEAAMDAPPIRLTRLLYAIRDDLAAGSSFADSIAKYTRFFPAWYVDLIRSGESTGNLVASLSSALNQLQTSQEFARKVRGWGFYLGGVFAFQLAMCAFIAWYLLPTFAEIQKDFGTPPPAIARWFLDLWSNPEFRRPINLSFALLAITVFVKLFVVRTDRGLGPYVRRHLRRALLFVPFINVILVKWNLHHFSNVLSTLLDARVPLDTALGDCAALSLDAPYRSAVVRIQSRVEQGQTLTQAIETERVFPRPFKLLVGLGENAGKLPECIDRLGKMYEREAVKIARIAVDVIGPLAVIALGVVVLVIELATFGSIANIYESLLNSL